MPEFNFALCNEDQQVGCAAGIRYIILFPDTLLTNLTGR